MSTLINANWMLLSCVVLKRKALTEDRWIIKWIHSLIRDSASSLSRKKKKISNVFHEQCTKRLILMSKFFFWKKNQETLKNKKFMNFSVVHEAKEKLVLVHCVKLRIDAKAKVENFDWTRFFNCRSYDFQKRFIDVWAKETLCSLMINRVNVLSY